MQRVFAYFLNEFCVWKVCKSSKGFFVEHLDIQIQDISLTFFTLVEMVSFPLPSVSFQNVKAKQSKVALQLFLVQLRKASLPQVTLFYNLIIFQRMGSRRTVRPDLTPYSNHMYSLYLPRTNTEPSGITKPERGSISGR